MKSYFIVELNSFSYNKININQDLEINLGGNDVFDV